MDQFVLPSDKEQGPYLYCNTSGEPSHYPWSTSAEIIEGVCYTYYADWSLSSGPSPAVISSLSLNFDRVLLYHVNFSQEYRQRISQ